MTESEIVFSEWFNSLPVSNAGGSGIPKGYKFDGGLQIFRESSDIFIYPPYGGCIVLSPNGTWEGDIAPFCD